MKNVAKALGLLAGMLMAALITSAPNVEAQSPAPGWTMSIHIEPVPGGETGQAQQAMCVVVPEGQGPSLFLVQVPKDDGSSWRLEVVAGCATPAFPALPPPSQPRR